jgi:hypothetical protein
MTSSATIAGYFPLILVSGAGAAARNSIGLVLVGGTVVGTLFTLFVIPSIYMLIAREHGRESVTDQTGENELCVLPIKENLRLSPGCRLSSDQDCNWEVACDDAYPKQIVRHGG